MSDMSVAMKELERYYKTLGLESGASLEEINQAYKDLAFIWHPDRIPKDNQRLLEKAVAKLQEINYAREQLRLLKGSEKAPQPSKTKSPSKPYSQPPPAASSREAKRPTRDRDTWEPKQPTRDRDSWKNYSEPSVQAPYSHVKRPHYADMSEADLRGADLKERDLSGMNLVRADLSEADLSDSFLHKINLEGANLSKSNLFRANLLQANLRGANLQEAKLIGADLSGADLSEADLRGAKVGYGNRIMVKLTGAILTGAIMPDGSIHR
jgi:curved DNA-binding protein CbpA